MPSMKIWLGVAILGGLGLGVAVVQQSNYLKSSVTEFTAPENTDLAFFEPPTEPFFTWEPEPTVEVENVAEPTFINEPGESISPEPEPTFINEPQESISPEPTTSTRPVTTVQPPRVSPGPSPSLGPSTEPTTTLPPEESQAPSEDPEEPVNQQPGPGPGEPVGEVLEEAPYQLVNVWARGVYPYNSFWLGMGQVVPGKPRCTNQPICRTNVWDGAEAKIDCAAAAAENIIQPGNFLAAGDFGAAPATVFAYSQLFPTQEMPNSFPLEGQPANPAQLAAAKQAARQACQAAGGQAIQRYLNQTYYPGIINWLEQLHRAGQLSWVAYQFNRIQFNFFYPVLYIAATQGV
jgi:hypothetical protein